MRLLVLDGSRVLCHLICRLVPKDVEVEYTASFDEAMDVLVRHAPDAVIVDVAPTSLPWHRFQEICCQHDPPIPVLFESCVVDRPEDAGLGTLCECSDFLAKPYHPDQLRDQIDRLLGRHDEKGSPTSARYRSIH